jgi:hypothetical protein
MASYGTNTNVQILSFGSANSSLDTKTSLARDVATSIINSHLNIDKDIENPSNAVSKCAEMYAAAILRSKPGEESKDHMWEQAQKLLESLRGDDVDDAPWRKSINVERFRGLVSADDIRPHDFVN